MCPFQEVGGEGRKEPQRVSSNLASGARRVYPSEGKRGDEATGAVLGASERLGPTACFPSAEQRSCSYCGGYRRGVIIRMRLSFFAVFSHCASKVIEINSHGAQPAGAFSYEVGDE